MCGEMAGDVRLTRVLVGFGVGILAVVYAPGVFARLGVPVVVVGLVILIVASRGLLRKRA